MMRRKLKGSLLLYLTIFLVAALVGGSWFYLEGPCGTRPVARALDEFAIILGNVYLMEEQSRTSGLLASTLITGYQAAFKEAQLVNTPSCLTKGRELILSGLKNALSSVKAQLEHKDQIEVNAYNESYTTDLVLMGIEFDRVEDCTPFCN